MQPRRPWPNWCFLTPSPPLRPASAGARGTGGPGRIRQGGPASPSRSPGGPGASPGESPGRTAPQPRAPRGRCCTLQKVEALRTLRTEGGTTPSGKSENPLPWHAPSHSPVGTPGIRRTRGRPARLQPLGFALQKHHTYLGGCVTRAGPSIRPYLEFSAGELRVFWAVKQPARSGGHG